MVRAFHCGWYQDLVTELPPVENGMIRARPRLGQAVTGACYGCEWPIALTGGLFIAIMAV